MNTKKRQRRLGDKTKEVLGVWLNNLNYQIFFSFFLFKKTRTCFHYEVTSLAFVNVYVFCFVFEKNSLAGVFLWVFLLLSE